MKQPFFETIRSRLRKPIDPAPRVAFPTEGGASRRRCRAFTLVDLMIAVVIAALIAAVAVPSYRAIVSKVRISRAISDMAQAHLALERFRMHNNDMLPLTLAEIGMGNMTDPWGNPYRYLNIEAGASLADVRKDRNLVPINTDYDLYSVGRDGASTPPLTARASRDDVIRANNGSFFGLADNY